MLAEIQPTVSKRLGGVSDLLPAVEDLMHESVRASSRQKSLAERAAHQHLESGGHRMRAKMTLEACTKLLVCDSDATILAASVELLHNASLIHDDVVDQSERRRGSKTVFRTYGSAVAICTGDLLLSAAYGVLSNLSDVRKLPEILTIIHGGTASAIQGQCAEVLPVNVGPEFWSEYQEVVIAKSGALLSMPLEMALTVAAYEDQIANAQSATRAFAVAYQIMDDMQDLEMDRGGDGRAPAFNALLILEAAGHGEKAAGIASSFAKFRLEEAIEAASLLPNGSGDLLIDFAEGMLAELS